MGQLNFATDNSAIVVSRTDNVVPFHARPRSSRDRFALAARPGTSAGVVVRLPLANRESGRGVFHTEQSIGNKLAGTSGTEETRFTSLDFIATALLILSVFAAPALVWSILRSASFG
jgi:hypothetical protein